jgi:hypothetical protein
MSEDTEALPTDTKPESAEVTLVPTEGEKIALPRRPGESKFAPQQYFYTSKTGAVPSWAASR